MEKTDVGDARDKGTIVASGEGNYTNTIGGTQFLHYSLSKKQNAGRNKPHNPTLLFLRIIVHYSLCSFFLPFLPSLLLSLNFSFAKEAPTVIAVHNMVIVALRRPTVTTAANLGTEHAVSCHVRRPPREHSLLMGPVALYVV
jgi:hypothetical protein